MRGRALKSDSGGPTPDPAVVRALAALNQDRSSSGLYPVWRRHLCWWIPGPYEERTAKGAVLAVSHGFGQTLSVRQRSGALAPVPRPRWHIVSTGTDRYPPFRLFEVQDEDGNALPLDMRVVQRIQRDVARWKSEAAVNQEIERARAEGEERAEATVDEETAAWIAANGQKVREAATHPEERKPVLRDPRIVSYRNQGSRATRLETIERTSRERGYVPWPEITGKGGEG